MRVRLSLPAITLLALSLGCEWMMAQATQTQSEPPLTNADVLDLVKAGLPAEIILEKVSSSPADFDTSADGLVGLKGAGVPGEIILAMVKADRPASQTQRVVDSLARDFRRLKDAVVTVWSETGHGTGFIVDKEGLVVTNQHVLGPSQYLAVQFDEAHKLTAVLLAASPEKDVAVLWINLEGMAEVKVAPLPKTLGLQLPLAEGERVWTIGSPLNQRKVMTSGIVSKVEERAIISDININPGNSGGPLFNSTAEVVGITTFADLGQGTPGIAGIVRIEEAMAVIAEAQDRMTESTKPSARFLPVEPTDVYPLDAIRAVASAAKFDMSPYLLDAGDFQVVFLTPALQYRIMTEAEREAAKQRMNRNKAAGAVQGTFRPFEDLYNWREYLDEYRPVLMIQATPEVTEGFWSAFGRGLAESQGIQVAASLHFKADFYRMRLLCNGTEIEPIHPGKVSHIVNRKDAYVNLQDATYSGFYVYPAEAISRDCRDVRLEIYSEKDPRRPTVKKLDARTVARIAVDFDPYLAQRAQGN